MLEQTFVHIPGIGYVTERRLWQAGIGCWRDALAAATSPCGFSQKRWELCVDTVNSSQRALSAQDYRYFAQNLAPRDHWRAFPEFRSRTAYLDIETDGSYGRNCITVVGLYDGLRCKTFVAGDNLHHVAEEIENYAMLVTFNGAGFDLPLLRWAFPHACWDHLHVDLRYPLAALGYRGGLKSIERQLGIGREHDLEGLSGDDAIWLWREYRRGSRQALDMLIRYNHADIVNLEALLDFAYPRLRQLLEQPPV